MAVYINKQELIHRLNNGFLSADGYVNDEFFDIYKQNGIDINDFRTKRILGCISVIIESMNDCSVVVYPDDISGSEIRRLRKSRGWSVGQLSIKTGLGKKSLYYIEEGKQKPRRKTMIKIMKALGV